MVWLRCCMPGVSGLTVAIKFTETENFATSHRCLETRSCCYTVQWIGMASNTPR